MTTAEGCVCCGGQDTRPGLPGLLACAQCGHSWADLSLSNDELRALYARDYYEGDEYADYALEAPALERNFRPRVRELAARHPRGSFLYEIGCAYGYFLKPAATHFRVAGCDISEHAVRQAREKFGLDVVAGDYLKMILPEPAASICLWDTVEHLARPDRYLAKAFADLAPGGTLSLSTGDMGALLPRLQGRRWRLIHPPTHLHYFTVPSMRRLLERAGFQQIHAGHPAFWRSADAVAFRLLAYPPGKRTEGLYRAVRGLGLFSFAFPLNTGDLMTVTAQKPAAGG